MTAEVEQRIVEMRFENEQFERGAKQSLVTLEKLEGVLDILAEGGIDKIGATLDTVQRRFSTFGIAGAAAVQRVTNSVMDLASSLLTAIPNQIISGGITRASNIERAQFQLKGLGVAWEEISDDIDFAVKDTAYGLDEAAVAAAQFAASLGSDSYKNAPGQISEMGRALRAISGVAGMTNSTYSEIANIFTGIAGTGHVMTQDLRMLEGRGLNVAAKLAEVLEEDGTNAHYTEQQIRDLVSKGKIGFRDFAKAMDAAFGEHAKKANETYTGSLANMKAALSRIGADYVSPIHNGMIKVQNGLRDTFNRLRDVTRPFAEGTFTNWVDRLSAKFTMLAGKVDFGWLRNFRDMLDRIDITPIENALDLVGDFMDAFNAFFDLSFRMKNDNVFAGGDTFGALADGIQRVNRLQRVFRAVRKALDFFGQGVKIVAKAMLPFLSLALKASDNLLKKWAELADSFSNKDFTSVLFAFSTAVNKISGQVYKFFSEGNFKRLISPLRAAFELLTVVSERFFNTIFKIGTDSRLGTLFLSLGSGILKAADYLTAFLDKIRDFIKEHGSFAKAMDDIQVKTGWLGDGLKKITDFVGRFFGVLLGVDSIDEVWEKLGRMFGFVGRMISNSFSGVAKSFDTLFSKDGLGTNAIQVAGALYSVLWGYRKLEKVGWAKNRFGRFLSFIGDIGGTLRKTYESIKSINPLEWADRIATVTGRVSGALRAFTDNTNAKSLIYIAGAVIGLAFGLSMLAAVTESGNLAPAVLALSVTMGVLIGAMWALHRLVVGTDVIGTFTGKLANLKKGLSMLWKAIDRYFQAIALKEMAKATLYFAAAVGVLALAVGVLAYTITKAGPGVFWQAVGAIAALITVLVAAVAVLGKVMQNVGMLDSTKFIAIGIAIVALAASIVILTVALGALAAVVKLTGAGAFWQAVGAIGALIVMLTAATVVLSKFAADPMVLFAAVAMTAVAAAVLIMAVALGILSAVISAFGWEGLGALALGLVLLGGSLALLSLVGPGVIIAAGAMVIAAGAILILSAAIAVIAVSLFALSILPMDRISNSATELIKVLASMAIVLGLLSLLGPGVLAAGGAILLAGLGVLALCSGLAELGLTLPSLAAGLRMLEGIDLTGVGKGMGKLAWGLAKLGMGGWINNIGSEGYASLIPLASALRMLELLDLEKLTNKDHGLAQLGTALKKFGGAGIRLNWGDMGLLGAGPAFSALAVGLTDLMPVLETMSRIEDFETPLAMFDRIGESVKRLGKASTYFEEIVSVGRGMVMITESLTTFPAELPPALTDLINFLQNGLTEEQIRNSFGIGEVLNSISQAVEGYKSNFETIGGNITIGIANGILSRTAEASNAMRSMASALQRSFTVSLQIHSPSRVMEQLAGYIPMGIARGIQNGTPQIAESIQTAMAPVLSAVEASSAEGTAYTPSIKPVMDLSDVRNGISNANRMFMGSSVGNISGLNGIHVNGDAINYNMANTDVVSELRSLEEQIVVLNTTIANMKLVLDSGQLVGGIASQMDKQFGVMDLRRGRGN